MTENERMFFDAVKSRNRNVCRQCINKGVDVNIKDSNDCTALMIAAGNNDVETVELLAKHGAVLDLKNDVGETALMIAVHSNAKDAGEFLYMNGADIDAADGSGRTPLSIAKELFYSKKSDWFFKNNHLKKIMKNRRTMIDNRLSEFFSRKNFGDVISFKEIEVFSREKYGIILGGFDISLFINETNKNEKERIIRSIGDSECLIYPSTMKIQAFFYEFFNNGISGTIITRTFLNNAFREKYHVDFDGDDVRPYISRCKYARTLKNGDFVIVPRKDEVEHFLDGFFLNKGVGTEIKCKDIEDSFLRNFHVPLDEIVFREYINCLVKNKRVQEVGAGVYAIMPPEDEIEHFLDGFFLNKSVGTEIERQEICVSFKQKYNMDLREDILNWYIDQYINGFNNKYTLKISRRIFKTCNEYFRGQVEYFFIDYKEEIFSNLLSFVLRVFLHECVGYSCYDKDIIKSFEDKYDLKISYSLFQMVIQEANKRLIDIKISGVRDESNAGALKLKSNFKCHGITNDNLCPICNAAFSHMSGMSHHILNEHTAYGKDCSVLTKTSDGEFYCHHCERSNLPLYEALPVAILLHMRGDCKKSGYSNSEYRISVFK